MDEQPNETRPNIPIWVWILGIFALILGLQFLFSGQFNAPQQIPLPDAMTRVRSGQVRTITLAGSRLTLTLNNNSEVATTVDPRSSLEETFTFYGITPDIIQDNNIEVQIRDQSARNNIFTILLTLGPILLLIWIFTRGFRQMQGGGGNNIFGFGRSRAKNLNDADRPTVTFEDVAGVDEAKLELTEVVQFLREPEKFVQVGARIPKGVLMVGPPGTGKTLLARAVAGEAGVPFFHISGSEFVEMFVGVGASRVRDLFDKAKQSAPSIVFVDEIDAVGRQRGAGMGGGHDEREQTLNQILVEMDGFDTDTHVIILAATNRPDILDPALMRPGRFDRRVIIDKPDYKGREAIFQVHLRGKPVASNVDVTLLARATPGFVGADIENTVNEAALLAARRNRRNIGMAEFQEAIERVQLGPERRSRVISPEEREITAYHEAGHAIVSHLLPHAQTVRKITIIPRGMAGGITWYLEEDTYFYSRSKFKAMIASALGGRVAEEIVFAEITTGASSDLKQVTKMARSMVTQYGMSEELGPRIYGEKQEMVFLGREISEQRDYSDAIAEKIDAEVRQIIDEAYERARQLLTEHRDKLELIAQKLLEMETLEAAEFVALMEGEDLPPRPPTNHPTRSGKTANEGEPAEQLGWNKPALDLPPSPSPA
jgi:cell division protease FtsH